MVDHESQNSSSSTPDRIRSFFQAANELHHLSTEATTITHLMRTSGNPLEHEYKQKIEEAKSRRNTPKPSLEPNA